MGINKGQRRRLKEYTKREGGPNASNGRSRVEREGGQTNKWKTEAEGKRRGGKPGTKRKTEREE